MLSLQIEIGDFDLVGSVIAIHYFPMSKVTLAFSLTQNILHSTNHCIIYCWASCALVTLYLSVNCSEQFSKMQYTMPFQNPKFLLAFAPYRQCSWIITKWFKNSVRSLENGGCNQFYIVLYFQWTHLSSVKKQPKQSSLLQQSSVSSICKTELRTITFLWLHD